LTNNNQIRICVPVCEQSVAELLRAFEQAEKAGDAVEIRLDCLDSSEHERAFSKIVERVRVSDTPTITTLRPAEQGGHHSLDYASRERFWTTQDLSASFLDIEFDLIEDFASRAGVPPLDWSRIICSHHDFACVPDNLAQIYERMANTPARILKIAFQADDVTDCLLAFRLLERARGEARELIAIAMGSAGIATRILGPSRGSFLTYGALDEESATAPGQITATELRELYRIDKIDRYTWICGLVGHPISHSVSPHMHNAAFATSGTRAVYIPFEVCDVGSFLSRMVRPRTRELDWDLRGLSVTAPHKSAVMDHLDWIDPGARDIGAVNTIVIDGDALHGYNTDVSAMLQPVIEKLGPLRDARCAVIGAGGAARAALWGLRREGASITLVARNEEKARSLAERFAANCEDLSGALFEGFDLIVNATPLGTSGLLEKETPAVSGQLRGARLAYDLVYNPIDTKFLREAREAGCETLGGVEMLVLQAAKQFELWTGIEAPVRVMRDAAKSALGAARAQKARVEIANRKFTIDNA
jgi:3-dehydroquinate dehydratase/shikimate dehydrogenase